MVTVIGSASPVTLAESRSGGRKKLITTAAPIMTKARITRALRDKNGRFLVGVSDIVSPGLTCDQNILYYFQGNRESTFNGRAGLFRSGHNTLWLRQKVL